MTDKLNIPSLDNHHADIFKMIHLLDDAIKQILENHSNLS